ncbi:MAG: Histone deacetylase-like amidohydrolase, partial [Planctomycetota bacterium]
VLISAGFDADRRDPIGSLGLDTEDFGFLADSVCEFAKSLSGGKVVACLEGGYHLEALANGVQELLKTLLKHSA